MKRYVIQVRWSGSKTWKVAPDGEYDTLAEAKAVYYALLPTIRQFFRIAEVQITTRYKAVKL